jgi:hypothetical protein
LHDLVTYRKSDGNLGHALCAFVKGSQNPLSQIHTQSSHLLTSLVKE